MIFINETGQDVEVGVYTASDRSYLLTLFDWGWKKRLSPGYNRMPARPGMFARFWPKEFQVIFWVGGQVIGPKLCHPPVVTLTAAKYIVDGGHPVTIEDKIDHIVVVALENRSFDNMLGWLYADTNNQPPRNIPSPRGTASPIYYGLARDQYWNTNPAIDHDTVGARRVYARRGVTSDKWWCAPLPNPHEVFSYFIEQMFGTEHPDADQRANMWGFLANYARLGSNPDQIMQCYSPEQVPVLSHLAKQFAVCDRWFASAPSETHPNRAFITAGTSFGRLNNADKPYDDVVPDVLPFAGKRTIFDVLDEQQISWEVYSDSAPPFSWVSGQFWTVFQKLKRRAHGFDRFEEKAQAGHLPAYSFIEPRYTPDLVIGSHDVVFAANDQHPGPLCDVRLGEAFLYRIWKAVSTSPAWNRTLLLITYDEHGGCYDHLAPPRTATPPDASQPQFSQFTKWNPFTLWGVRVPAVLVSPYIEPGTVFRSGTDTVEYDHTSVLATLRDWIFRNGRTGNFLDSERIKKAPTLWPVLTRSEPRTDTNIIPPPQF